MKLPHSPEELLPYLGSFGIAIAAGKILASSQRLTRRLVIGRAIEGATLCMCAGVGLLFFPDASPFAVLGVGGLLASLGVSGITKLISSLRGNKK